MRMGRRQVRVLALAMLGLGAFGFAAGAASAENFLEALFGGIRQQVAPAEPPAIPYAEATATPSVTAPSLTTPSVTAPPADSGGAYSHVASFCVRLCDGRFFPVQRHAGTTPIQTCNSLCPAAKTQIFTGSAIAHASATNGARYADLANAFVYRRKIVPGCTCNGHDAFGLAAIDVANDPTLRAGDLVATENGLQRFSGAPAQQHKTGGSPMSLSEAASPRRRVAATGVAAAD